MGALLTHHRLEGPNLRRAALAGRPLPVTQQAMQAARPVIVLVAAQAAAAVLAAAVAAPLPRPRAVAVETHHHQAAEGGETLGRPPSRNLRL